MDLSMLERAITKSFDKVAGSSTSTTMTDLNLYEKMTPQALNLIAETYGADNLMQYVTTMESLRLKKETNNG